MHILINVGNVKTNATIKINDEKEIFLVNNKHKNVDIDEFIMKLQSIISSWQLVMEDNAVIDGGWYNIKIKSGDKVRNYIGKNAFPINYDAFIELINGVR
jgi:hypothetical protein